MLFVVICVQPCAEMCGVRVCKHAKTVIVLAHQVRVPQILSQKHENAKYRRLECNFRNDVIELSVAKEKCTI